VTGHPNDDTAKGEKTEMKKTMTNSPSARPSLASNCSQGGSRVLPMSTKGTGATWHRQRQRPPSTHPQPCEQLLAGWIAGATNINEDDEGNMCINDDPAPASNHSQSFLLRSFSFLFFFCFVHSFFILLCSLFCLLFLFHLFFDSSLCVSL
jgi:hypothetical protein